MADMLKQIEGVEDRFSIEAWLVIADIEKAIHKRLWDGWVEIDSVLNSRLDKVIDEEKKEEVLKGKENDAK